MNNKGQALIIFILLLPIIFLLIACLVDMGNYMYEKSVFENEVKSTIEYGLKHMDNKDNLQKMENLLDSNIPGKKNITINNEVIKIKVTYPVKSLFSNIIDFDYKIDISYIGYNNNGKIIIKKE